MIRQRLPRAFALLGVLVALLAATPLASIGQGRTTPPNIIVIVTDDMRASDWQAMPKTQELFRNRGTWFPNFIVTTPACCPSRTTILTGQYVHNHGVLTNSGEGGLPGGWRTFKRKRLERETVAFGLRRSGYRTALVGKFLNGFRKDAEAPGGWDFWVASITYNYRKFSLNFDGKTQSYRGNAYKTDVLRRFAVRVVQQTPKRQPLFLYFTPTAPHFPATPAKRHREEFADATAPRNASFDEADVSDKPDWVRQLPLLGNAGAAKIDELERNRLRTLLATDEAIAAIWKAVERSGRANNTYVFIMSDNGFMMGEHRVQNKDTPYDGSVRVPMLAFGPGFDAGVDQRLASTIDIAPTIADIAGRSLGKADGRSLLDSWERDAVLIELFAGPAKGAGIRTQDYLYYELATGEREFYDYDDDPAELTNLLADGVPEPPEVEAAAERLDELRDCAGVECQ